jgi:hypothetical protein
MLYEYLVRAVYHRWLRICFAVVLIYQTFIRWIEVEIPEQGKLNLQLMHVYAFSDFALAKRYLNSSPELGLFSPRILLE